MIKIADDWTLFLDRDGVINKRIIDDYVKKAEDFEFLPNTLQAIKIFSSLFKRIFVVTNQQGIGKGLMTTSQLNEIHQFMIETIVNHGGKIDKVYFSPDLRNTYSFTRKPAVGMGLQARKDFPEIRLTKSIMVGDTHSDIVFGYRLGMTTVMVGEDKSEIAKCGEMLNYSFKDLLEFAEYLTLK